MLSDPEFRRTAACGKWKKILAERDDKIPKYDVEVAKGSALTAASIAEHGGDVPVLVEEPPSTLGMRIPAFSSLQDVAASIGAEHPVKLISVGTQEQVTGRNVTLGNFADYLSGYSSSAHKVLNMITLEFSNTNLGAQVETPAYVRDCDWIDSVWPLDRRSRGEYPAVQKYCLSGMADSFTDFHVDFGGTSVFYHVIHGRKRFYLVPPSTENLKAYAKWTTSSGGENQFFGDLIQAHSQPGQPQLFVLDLLPGQTLMIPGGWIHAVYTPEDSLVIGGNFLTSAKIVRQLQVAQIEQMTRVGKQYSFPFFKELNFYVLLQLLPLAQAGVTAAQVAGNGSFEDIDWEEVYEDEEDDLASAAIALLNAPNVLRQVPYLVRQCEVWCSGGQSKLAKEDAVRLEAVAKSSIAQYTEKDQESIESVADIFTAWWAVLSSAAELHLHDAHDAHDATGIARTKIIDHIHRIRASHTDQVDFLDPSFVRGGLEGLNSWPEAAVLNAPVKGTYQFSAPSTEPREQEQDYDEEEAAQEVQSGAVSFNVPITTVEEVNWVQCSSCDKWRTAPASVDVDVLPDDWVCSSNTWDPQHNTCEVDEETTTEVSRNITQSATEKGELSGIILRLPNASPISKVIKAEGIDTSNSNDDDDDEDLFGDADTPPKENRRLEEKEGDSSGLKLSISALKRAKPDPETGTEAGNDGVEDDDAQVQVRKKRKIHLTLAPKAKKIRSAEPNAYALHYEPLIANDTAESSATGRTRGKKLSKGFLQDSADVEIDSDDENAVSEDGGDRGQGPEFTDNFDGRDMAYEEEEGGPDVTEADFEMSDSDSTGGLSDGDDSGYEDEEALSDDGLEVVHVEDSGEQGEETKASRTGKNKHGKTKNISATLGGENDAAADGGEKAGIWKVNKFTGASMSVSNAGNNVNSSSSSRSSSAGMPSLASLVGAGTTKGSGNIVYAKKQSSNNAQNNLNSQATRAQIPTTSRSLLAAQTGRSSARPVQRAPPSRAELMKLMNKRR